MARLGTVVAPLGVEALALRCGDHPLDVVRSGVGPERARRMAERLFSLDTPTLSVAGLCGALDSEIAPGELIVPDEIHAADCEPRRVDAVPLRERLAERGLPARGGLLLGVDHSVVGDERADLRKTGAVAVDMESPWLAAGAAERPFVVLRVVLDGPQHELVRPGTVMRGVRALMRLRDASAALAEWAASREANPLPPPKTCEPRS